MSVSLSVFLVLAAPKVVIVLRVGLKVGARLKVCAFALELTAKRYHVAVLVEVRVKRIAKRRAKQGYLKLLLCLEAVKFVFLSFHLIPKFGYLCSAVYVTRCPAVYGANLRIVEDALYSL